jgi:hypothetical protein
MADHQSRTFTTAGDLKRELQSIPDETKLSFGDGSKAASMGVSFQRDGNGVILGAPQQAQQRT